MITLSQKEAYPLQPEGVPPFRVVLFWDGLFYEELHEHKLEGAELEAFEDRAAESLRAMRQGM